MLEGFFGETERGDSQTPFYGNTYSDYNFGAHSRVGYQHKEEDVDIEIDYAGSTAKTRSVTTDRTQDNNIKKKRRNSPGKPLSTSHVGVGECLSQLRLTGEF